jgi:esterase/lipase
MKTNRIIDSAINLDAMAKAIKLFSSECADKIYNEISVIKDTKEYIEQYKHESEEVIAELKKVLEIYKHESEEVIAELKKELDGSKTKIKNLRDVLASSDKITI